MLTYPSIEHANKLLARHRGEQCIAYHKYDGSNLRWEWGRKTGWMKMGTRRQLFDASHPLFSQAIPLFQEHATEILRQVQAQYGSKIERITIFTEFFGNSSFAGKHVSDEAKQLRLIDCSLYKKGFLTAHQLYSTFSSLPIAPELAFRGEFNEELIERVRTGELGSNEGVIIRGLKSNFIAKAKNQAWYDMLRERYGDEYEELA